jgi:hypothetical protein
MINQRKFAVHQDGFIYELDFLFLLKIWTYPWHQKIFNYAVHGKVLFTIKVTVKTIKQKRNVIEW